MYNNGDLVGQGSWSQQSTIASFPLQVVDILLTYNGYVETTDTGKSVKIDNSGQDAYKEFTTQSGENEDTDIYFSALVNFSQVQSINSKNGEYFLHLGEGAESIYNFGRVFVKQSVNGDKMIFGISRATTGVSASWGDTEYELNKTHLVVVRYTIVSGDKNDIVSLYINPNTASEPTTPLAVFNSTGSGTIDPIDIKSINIRQGTGSLTPIGHVGALRVSKTWQDLFNDSPPIETPKLTISEQSTIAFGNVYPGEPVTKTINIKGEYLKGDIQITGLTSGELSVSTNTITKEQAENENGFDLTLTLDPDDTTIFTDEILFDSPEISQIKISAYWTTATLVENLSELRSLFETNQLTSEVFKLKNNVLVSHVYTGDSKPIIYVQDSYSAITIQDISSIITSTYKEGDSIKISGTMDKAFGTTYFYPSRDFNMPTSENNSVSPTIVTLAELNSSPALYEAQLIKVENVNFYDRENENGGIFKQGTNNKIDQNGSTAAISVFKEVDYIDETIPETATIIGIFRSPGGKLIAPRYKADIINTPLGISNNHINNIEIWNENSTLHIKGESIQKVIIYNIVGTQVAIINTTGESFSREIKPGIYVVKVTSGNEVKSQKIIVK